MPNKLTANTDLIVILLISITTKTAVIILLPSFYHADENFQLFEQGHRLAFGYGIKPWEFEDGIRSPVLPAVLSGIFGSVGLIADRPEVYIGVARAILALFSLLAVASVYYYALTISRTHALLAAAVLAVWYEPVYFSVRPLTEGVAATALICSICWGLLARRGERLSLFAVSGFFASLAVTLRFHIGFGVFVMAIWICLLHVRRRWLPFILGALPPLVLFGVSDWIAWGAPFSTFMQSLKINLVDGKSAHFGVEPFYWFFSEIWSNWFICTPLFAGLIAYKFSEKLPWVLVGGTIILSHSLIAHKEYRFIYPALMCFIVAAALGSADVLQKAVAALPKRPRLLTALILLLWCSASVALAMSPPFFRNWNRSRQLIRAYYFLSTRSDMCGLITYETGWWDSGGYAHLHRNVPIYDNLTADFEPEDVTPLANYVVGKESSLGDFEGRYKQLRCFEVKKDSICILRRRGPCKLRSDIVPLALQRRLGED
jgi:GPI mannosyltransferase 3